MSYSEVTTINNTKKNEPEIVWEQLQMQRTEGTQHNLLGSVSIFYRVILDFQKIDMASIILAFLHVMKTTICQTLCYTGHKML